MRRNRHFEAPPEPEEQLLTLDAGHFFADDFGTTAAEQASHEPLDARLARERPDVEPAETVESADLPEVRRFQIDTPLHWNVIATAHPHQEAQARATLATFGEIHDSPFANVVLATVDDVGVFTDELATALIADAGARHALARVLPAQHTFRFDSLADLEAITRRLIGDWIDDLEDATFYVRCHRRGQVNDLDPAEEEDFLGDLIRRTLAERGAPGRVTFEDPDVVIDIETFNDEAAISMWTRDDLAAYPFLRID